MMARYVFQAYVCAYPEPYPGAGIRFKFYCI